MGADAYQLAGFAGVAVFLAAYALLQLGVVRGNSYVYALLNLIAATLVLVSLFSSWNLFLVITQVSFILLSLFGILRVWYLTHRLRFTEEEQAMLDAHFPTLRRMDARPLLRAGIWQTAPAGTELTKQDYPVTQLTYIADGGVDIHVSDQVIAQVGSGSFVGEMGCMGSAPASATACVNKPSRIFSVTSKALRRLVKRNPDLGAHIDFAFAGNTRASLMATNERLQQSLADARAVSAKGEIVPK